MDFCELIAKTNYSFLEGASHPEEMVFQAQALGYRALGIADTNGVYGIPRAHTAAKSAGLSLIVGSDITWGKDRRAWLLAENYEGYGNLCELLSHFHTGEGFYDLFSEKNRHLLVLVPAHPHHAVFLPELKERFQDKLYLVASRFHDGKDWIALESAHRLSHQFGIPCIASNQPLFHSPRRKPLQDVLTCIRHTCSLKNAGFRLLPNLERHLKPLDEIKKLFKDYPRWIENTREVASRCRFSLDEIRYHYPNEWLPPGETGDTYLEKLVEEGAKVRYQGSIPESAQKQIRHELTLIRELNYSDYFLTIWDIVQFAKSKSILYQGRGSAANSIVCYVLGITAIDPMRMDLLFERFISRERNEPPDIDIDFEHERREEVIQYLYQRYGRDRAAITAEVICFRRRSAIREVAKVFELPLPTVERFLTLSHKRSLNEISEKEWATMAPDLPKQKLKQYLTICESLLSFPRHLGTHVGGFVLSQNALNRNVPVESAAMKDRTIIQWNKDDLDALGFVRVDILGLGILTAIRKTFEYLKEIHQVFLTLATIPAEDPNVYDSVGRGDTIGVFQIESRAQMNMLPRLRPKTFFDLVVEVSIVRPGPIQGDMVHPYLRRRLAQEKIEYPHPDLKSILEKTYGVPLFQEQIMKMAMRVAGFSAGEADELRRAMGSWRRLGKNRLTQMGEKFRQGLLAKGIQKDFAARVFQQIEGFAEYGFPESHAASFALLAYATAYLKYYYPDAFVTALLNSQPMGFYQNHTLIEDAKRHGVHFLGIDVNLSRWDNRLEKKNQVRLGFREIRSLSQNTAQVIARLSQETRFSSFPSFIERLKDALYPKALTKRELFLLAGANAFSSLGLERREALWEIQALSLSDSWLLTTPEDPATLSKESSWEKIAHDFEAQGVSLFQHPMAFLRPELKAGQILSSVDILSLREGQRVRVAGIVICRQMPPTASGVLFITLEDEFGFINLVIWNKTYQRFKEPLITQSFLLCGGKIQKAQDGNVLHVIVEEALPLFTKPSSMKALTSHDFH